MSVNGVEWTPGACVFDGLESLDTVTVSGMVLIERSSSVSHIRKTPRNLRGL